MLVKIRVGIILRISARFLDSWLCENRICDYLRQNCDRGEMLEFDHRRSPHSGARCAVTGSSPTAELTFRACPVISGRPPAALQGHLDVIEADYLMCDWGQAREAARTALVSPADARRLHPRDSVA